MHRNELENLLNEWLKPSEFKDSATNGLQIEGKEDIHHIVCGVSANLALIEQAVACGADALVVHHGLFWEPGLLKIRGWAGQRIARLINARVNLFAFHLPLDAHPTIGNNAALADVLGLDASREPFGVYKGKEIGFSGSLKKPCSLSTMLDLIETKIGEPVAVFGDLHQTIKTVGVCSGGAPDLLSEAIEKGLDLFVTGEVTEWVKAMSDETGVAFVAAGHHATERFGVQNVARKLAEQPDLTAEFVDVPNPV